jgi:hypothetical protein
VNNPLFILQTLDRHLDHPVELTLYGRAALALGFASHLTKHETTQDVDVIIPIVQLDAFQADEKFWAARDATNAELLDKGLYLVGPEKTVLANGCNWMRAEGGQHPDPLKPKKGGCPQPLLQVPRRRGQEQVHLVARKPLQEAARQPILVFQVADHRLNRRPPPEPCPHLRAH